MKIGRYARVSKKEQTDRDALNRQLFLLDRATVRLGGTLEQELLYVDVQSGREDNRPDFERLVRDIEGSRLDMVILNRVDRITRDLETNARLAKLFERTGVKLFEIEKDDLINFKKPADWSYFVNCGVEAERESRVLSSRILAGWEFLRHQGKAPGRVPFGYFRNANGEYEKHPKNAVLFRKMIEIFNQTKNLHWASKQIEKELGIKRSPKSLGNMFRNEAYLGNTVYLERVGKTITIPNTHEPLLSIEEKESIERIIAQNRNHWGSNQRKIPHLFAGLVCCQICKGKAVTTVKKYNGREYVYVSCGNREHKFETQRISYREEKLLELVIKTLCEKAENIAQHTVENIVSESDTAEVLSLKLQIQKIKELISIGGDEDNLLTRRISQLEAKISQSKGVQYYDESLKELLIQVGSNIDYWQQLTEIDKRVIFIDLIQTIWLGENGITIDFKV